ncbi:hypothetical protein L195_g022750 [Trifolium pratense]|uniref:Uncharacterized protein n=1 Tax=Trifolium pratense TaxID=57577 RepID=A0A2K3N8Z9_TRIPR|nr:uncharacterized protein LOC123891643 [Trifolium pratense]PNX99484.1 hypothetical protein L195_g022750 [Trifolium pratense]
MESVEYQPNSRLAAVYFNGGNANLLRIHEQVSLGDLKQQLTQINRRLNPGDPRTVTDVEYRRPSGTSNNGTLLFTNVKLRNNGDVITMFFVFSEFRSYVPIELDAKLVRSVENILSCMIPPNRPRTYDEIAAPMVRPEEDEVEAISLSDP